MFDWIYMPYIEMLKLSHVHVRLGMSAFFIEAGLHVST